MITIETGKLYKIDMAHNTPATNNTPLLLIEGATVDLNIVGAVEEPADLGEMTTILESNLTDANWCSFYSLPKYVSFIGTFDSITPQNVDITLIGDITV